MHWVNTALINHEITCKYKQKTLKNNDNFWFWVLCRSVKYHFEMIFSWNFVGIKSIDKKILQKYCIAPTRSTRPEVFCKKGVLKNFAKFTGKHLSQSLFFNNVAGLSLFAFNFIKKDFGAVVFLWILRNF